jgi:Protein kinase domain
VVKKEGKPACPVCGTLLADDSQSYPVCPLRGALEDKPSFSESPLEPTLSPSQLRLEHYEILAGEDGTPFELGRGAMGVTYKAIDVNLRCAVALKVINARWVGDELARRRFIREARAAASVRHPNVASVFYLGKSGDIYFYAMEFVEGETLQNRIRREGPLDVRQALEIATQVAAGLAAVNKQKLIHRDIKSSNIMMSSEGGGAMAAKIIDLGLAKPATESASDAGISTRGAFAGTPEFASPEQFAGLGADRSGPAFPDPERTFGRDADGHTLDRGEPCNQTSRVANEFRRQAELPTRKATCTQSAKAEYCGTTV